MIFNNIYETIGRTPMVKLNNLGLEDTADIFVKLESFNPSGSVKDRASLYMIENAEKEGLLTKGGTIIEPTSGNTGIGLSMIGAAKGYNVILVMPDTMSMERRKLMKAYGAEIILTEGKYGMSASVELAEKLAKENGYFMPNQFSNTNNRKAHYETTALEILEDTGGNIDAFVAGVGTGGSISGVGKRLKEYKEEILTAAVQPEKSQVLRGSAPSPHGIQGLGANFIPDIFDKDVVDEIIDITDEDAFKYSRILGKKEGILAGISSGANLAGAIIVAKRLGKGKKVVVILPDTGERYLSTSLFTEE
jgi:cysteine synthase A